MKKSVLIVFIALMTGVGFSSYAQENNSKEQRVKTAVENRNYVIRVNQAIPQRGKSQFLTSEYSLGVRNDSIFSYLPYYGVAYNIPYGGGKGLIFDAPITAYKEKKKKKNSYLLEIETQNEEGNYVYKVTIFSNGSSSIHVQSSNRQGITFYGELKQEE